MAQRLNATVSTTTEIHLSPSIRTKLVTALRTYYRLKTQAKEIEVQLDHYKTVVACIREETGEMSLSVEGFTTSLVAPIRKVFNKKKFVSLGGDLALYEMAMDNVPSAPYEKISLPKEQE